MMWNLDLQQGNFTPLKTQIPRVKLHIPLKWGGKHHQLRNLKTHQCNSSRKQQQKPKSLLVKS